MADTAQSDELVRLLSRSVVDKLQAAGRNPTILDVIGYVKDSIVDMGIVLGTTTQPPQLPEPPRPICSKVLHRVELILERSNVADLRHAIARLPGDAVITEIIDLGGATGITFGQTFYEVDEEDPF